MPHPEALWVMLDELEKPVGTAVDREELVLLSAERGRPRDVITRYVSQDVLNAERLKERGKEQAWFLELMERMGYDLSAREAFQRYFDQRK